MVPAVDTDIVSYASIFVHDCILDITTMTNAHSWQSMASCMIDFFEGFIIIITHQVAADNGSAIANPGADTDYTVFNPGSIYDASFGDDGFLQCSATDLCRREHAGPGVDRFCIVE